jgi:RNA polymerase primary sigma factor
MEEKQLTSRELEEQANALLAEADFEEIKLPKKAKKAAAAKKAEQENEQAEKPAAGRKADRLPARGGTAAEQ